MTKLAWFAVIVVIAMMFAIGKAIVDVVDKPRESYTVADIGVDEKIVDSDTLRDPDVTPAAEGVDDDDLARKVPIAKDEVVVIVPTQPLKLSSRDAIDELVKELGLHALLPRLVHYALKDPDIALESLVLIGQHIDSLGSRIEGAYAKDLRKSIWKDMYSVFELRRRGARLADRKARINEMDAVNAAAARVMTQLVKQFEKDELDRGRYRKSVWRVVEDMVDGSDRYEYSNEHLEAAVRLMASFPDREAWAQLADKVTPTRADAASVRRSRVVFETLAAIEPPNDVRYQLTRELLRYYAAPEATARDGDPKAEAYWKQIGPSVVALLQHLTRHPRWPYGDKPLETVHDFQAWFRDHKKPNATPWVPEKAE